jgi:hypothetical protein
MDREAPMTKARRRKFGDRAVKDSVLTGALGFGGLGASRH